MGSKPSVAAARQQNQAQASLGLVVVVPGAATAIDIPVLPSSNAGMTHNTPVANGIDSAHAAMLAANARNFQLVLNAIQVLSQQVEAQAAEIRELRGR